MRKFIPSGRATTLTAILLICVTVIFITNACRKLADKNETAEKEMVIRNRFFTVSSTVDLTVQSIARNIYRQDQQRNFVPELSQKAGYPIWDKAKIARNPLSNSETRVDGGGGGGGSTEIVLIPFVKGGKYITNAVLAANISSGGDTTFKLLYATSYADFGFNHQDTTVPDARDIFHLFTAFDNDLFGHSVFP